MEDDASLTAPQEPLKKRGKRGGRQGGCLPWVIAIVVMITAYAIWQFPSFKAEAELGAAYAARVGCSCRYVEGREIGSCSDDFMEGMELVTLTDAPEDKAVIGSVPLLATRTAKFAGESGCLLQPKN